MHNDSPLPIFVIMATALVLWHLPGTLRQRGVTVRKAGLFLWRTLMLVSFGVFAVSALRVGIPMICFYSASFLADPVHRFALIFGGVIAFFVLQYIFETWLKANRRRSRKP